MDIGGRRLTTETPKHRKGNEKRNAEAAENAEGGKESAPTVKRNRWQARRESCGRTLSDAGAG